MLLWHYHAPLAISMLLLPLHAYLSLACFYHSIVCRHLRQNEDHSPTDEGAPHLVSQCPSARIHAVPACAGEGLGEVH